VSSEREVIRVTSALVEVREADASWFTVESRLRGSAVHDAVKIHATGIDVSWLDDAYQRYWQGYLRFLRETRFKLQSCEEPIFDEAAGYAGRYDLLGQLPDLRGTTAMDLIDVKTGSAPSWTALQTMAYRRCVKEPRVRRWALELPGNDSYQLIPLNMDRQNRIDSALDRKHERVVLAAITIASWKRGWIR
jgi:hypothetical protein